MVKQKNIIGDNDGTPYTPEETAKLIKALGKILSNARRSACVRDSLVGVLDPANVCAVVALTERAKVVLGQFIDAGEPEGKLPELKYFDEPMRGPMRVSSEYFSWAVDFLTRTDERVKVESAKDYPIRLSTTDWSVIIAPRVNNDD